MPVMKSLTVDGTTYTTVGEATATQTLTSGTEIATITIDGTATKLYAPTQTSITVDSALSGSSTNPVQNKVINTALGNKQATLVSGTNIKTVNSTSLLGSGDVAVQPTLVSGTNIKTINGNSLLGSGDLSVSATVDSALSSSSTNPVQNKVINSALNAKQEKLVAGTNIKNVNGYSLLGSGNIITNSFDTSYILDIKSDLVMYDSLYGSEESSGIGASKLSYPMYEFYSSVMESVAYIGVLLAYKYIDTYEDAELWFLVLDPYGDMKRLHFNTSYYDMEGIYKYRLADITPISQVDAISTSVTLASASWSGTSYTINISDVSADSIVTVAATPSSISDYTAAGVYCSAQASGSLTFSCSSAPSSDIGVNITIINGSRQPGFRLGSEFEQLTFWKSYNSSTHAVSNPITYAQPGDTVYIKYIPNTEDGDVTPSETSANIYTLTEVIYSTDVYTESSEYGVYSFTMPSRAVLRVTI